MSYRSILVQVDASAGSAARSRFAAALAQRFEAHLSGVFLRTEFIQQYLAGGPLPGLPPAQLGGLVEDHRSAVEKTAAQARDSFESAARETGVEHDWLVISGDSPREIVDCARRVDLTLFPAERPPMLGDYRISAADLAMESGGPVLILPASPPEPPLGRRILVAWNGSREAARALRDARPLLAGAEQVQVLTVRAREDVQPDLMLQRQLQLHGKRPQLHVEVGADASVADILLDRAHTMQADLVVMGIYGRSRVRELVLGGTSHDILRDVQIPLLVSH